MERKSTKLLGEAQEAYIVEVAARLEMMCRGVPTEPVPQQEIDLFRKALDIREARRDERRRQEMDALFTNQFPIGFNPFQPSLDWPKNQFRTTAPQNQAQVLPQYEPTFDLTQNRNRSESAPQDHIWPESGRQMRDPRQYHHQINQAERLPYPVSRNTENPLAPNERQQILRQEVLQHDHVVPARSMAENAEYYVELNKAFLRTWEMMESMRHVRGFDEKLFLQLAELEAPAPPGFVWTSWGLICCDD